MKALRDQNAQCARVIDPKLELALSECRAHIEVELEKIRGEVALLRQRAEQADKRDQERADRLDGAETRLRAVEQSAVTRNDLNSRTKHIYAIVGLMLTAASVLAMVVVALI